MPTDSYCSEADAQWLTDGTARLIRRPLGGLRAVRLTLCVNTNQDITYTATNTQCFYLTFISLKVVKSQSSQRLSCQRFMYFIIE